MQVVKVCKFCKEEKPITEFYKAKSCIDGHRGLCKPCQTKCNKLQCNPENRKKYEINYRKNNKEKENARVRQWATNNKEKCLEKQRKWQKNNKEKCAGYHRKWSMTNNRKDYYKNYAKNNPEKRTEIKKRQRAKRKGVIIEKFNTFDIFERDNWICQICKKKIDKKMKYPNLLSPSLDHIIPLAMGGNHERMNVQTAHFICNSLLGIKGIKQTRLF